MAAKESIKNTDEGAASRNFYGLAEHPNNGILSSILKRKGRKLGMTDDCKAMCKQTEAYKGSADRLHQALMYVLVENPVTSRALVQVVRTEPTWRYAATYLKSFDFLQKQGRKGNYENLEPAIKSLENMDAEHEKRVRRQLDILKPLTKFIGDDYWEYARLRKIYWDAIEAYDDAVTLQNKERTEQSEQATANAQAWRNECRVKMMEFIKKAINDQKGKHAECVLKFREEAIAHHRSLGELMTLEVRETTSVVKQPQPISK